MGRLKQLYKVIENMHHKKNSNLNPQEIEEYCKLGDEETEYINDLSNKKDFSKRAISGCLKVARTIADMELFDQIREEHILEAISYRHS